MCAGLFALKRMTERWKKAILGDIEYGSSPAVYLPLCPCVRLRNGRSEGFVAQSALEVPT